MFDFPDAARGMSLCLDDGFANTLGSPASESASHVKSENCLGLWSSMLEEVAIRARIDY